MYLSTSILTVIFQDAVQTGSAEVGVVTPIYITFNTTEFELRFYVRTDTKYVISETFFLSTQLCMHQRMVCATQFNSYCTKLSTSFLLSYDPDRPELNLIGYKIQGVYSSVNMSCKSTKLKKSSSDWLNSGKALIQHLSENVRFYCLCVSAGSAEALVRWGGKIKYHLTAYLPSNISAKNCQNRLMYVEVIASQSNDVIIRHSVIHVQLKTYILAHLIRQLFIQVYLR